MMAGFLLSDALEMTLMQLKLFGAAVQKQKKTAAKLQLFIARAARANDDGYKQALSQLDAS